MCVIIHKPVGVTVPSSLLEQAAFDNPHGWGVMVPKPRGGISIYRGFKTRDVMRVVDRIGPDRACTVHLRIATHGGINHANLHPFDFNGGRYALVHNGIIRVPIRNDERSDTWHFTHDIIAPMLKGKPELFESPEFPEIVEHVAGDGNKVVILRDDGAQVTAGWSDGTEYLGLWLSNEYSLPGKSRWSSWKGWGDDGQWTERKLVKDKDGAWEWEYPTAPKAKAEADTAPLALECDYTLTGAGRAYLGRSIHDASPENFEMKALDRISAQERKSPDWESLDTYGALDRADLIDCIRADPEFFADQILREHAY